MPFEIDRGLYARLYGPTTGDRVRLGDTNLWVEVERDLSVGASPGDETLWGFGKTIRDAMQMTGHSGRDSTLDLIIGGALVLGFGKELWDLPRTGFDPGDLAAGALGALLAGLATQALER